MTHEQLFIYTIDDIVQKQYNGDEYSMIRACGLLRHLLLDESPLIHLANKNPQLKIRFIISDHEDLYFANWNGVCQIDLHYIYEKSKEVTLNQFMSFICFQIKEHQYKVSEIINIGCHREGGIHSQPVQDEKEAYMISIDRLILIDQRLFLESINSICNVVVNSTNNLYCAIKGHPPTDGFNHFIKLP